MKIAILNEDRRTAEHLRNLLDGNTLVSGTCLFPDFDCLCEELDGRNYFDLVLLGLEWRGGRNGIDLAERLLKLSPQTQIIYVTGPNDWLFQHIFLKSSNLCGYLVTPVDVGLLEALLAKAQHYVDTMEGHKLLVQQKGRIHMIPYREICYLESHGHQLFIHTLNDSILCYERLEELKKRLPPQFYQCHKSYLVNLELARRIDKTALLLKTGEEIPISKARYSGTCDACSSYRSNLI